ncbi:Mil1p NDAI_0G03090 [Naumovozyma dairenensis CBS 421]|uniref:DUF726 domain protein n=1 Tax=Naumovozyma dairenensis (strain ATCC 10597 / BCRC 20456 / CBS 421 / NBRC 0211 / NRRL Y-12639) TaxID=1071378 RepID=G0WE75_NAUDC|nr:hypothetical protein NDAI_0G03090 [Naumovozyma dairenensis CBS 421]CCD26086.2 hypothetical protein NDAI_0G03090 [Naumovozyma dairenensis CBS 421]
MSDSEEDLGIELKGLKISKYLKKDTETNRSQQSNEEKHNDEGLGSTPLQETLIEEHSDTNEAEDHSNSESSSLSDNNGNLTIDSLPMSYRNMNLEEGQKDVIENSSLNQSLSPSFQPIRSSETPSISSRNEPHQQKQEQDISPNDAIPKAKNDHEDTHSLSSDDTDDDSEWQTMPAVASYNVYNKNGELELKPYDSNEETFDIEQIQKTGKYNNKNKQTFDYTKVAEETQAQRSYLSNKKTDFLFEHKKLKKALQSKNKSTESQLTNYSSSNSKLNSEITLNNPEEIEEEEEEDSEFDEFEDDVEAQDDLNPTSQLSVTKDLLSDMEKFAYLGAVNVLVNQMCTDLATVCLCVDIKSHKKLASRLHFTQKDMAAWKTVILSRLYEHLAVSQKEIEMIEKLSLHKIQLEDLCKCLKTTQNVENPWEKDNKKKSSLDNSQEKGEKNKSSLDNSQETDANSEKMRHSNEEEGTIETKTETKESTSMVPQKVIKPENINDQNRLNIDIAWTIICDLFLVFLQNYTYDARSRTLLIKFAKALNITKLEICEFEKRITDSLDMEQSTEDQEWNETDHMKSRRKRKRRKKMAYVGLAMVGGSLVLGLSGGLLAPVIGAGIAAGLSTIGIGGATGFLTGVGGTTVVALSSTAIGANIGARGMSKRMGSVRTFEFRPLHNNRRVNLILSVSGWIIGNEDDVRLPFSTVDPLEGDLYSLYWEPEMLKSTGQTINIVASEVFTQTIQQVLGATILTGLMSAIQWPMALSKLGYILDNPWNVSLDRAWAAGLILADTLMSRNLGERPITLVGFSLGARVIFSCLIELSKRKASGLVENVFIFGTPIVRKREHLVMARSIVSGRFVNGYSDKDWVLAYLFRATGGGFKAVMGISPIEDINEIENFNCTEFVDGHMAYRKNMPKLLREMGIAVLDDTFVEIEEIMDPNEYKRKRKLVHDVDAAQKKLSERKKHNSWMPKWLKPKKSKWQVMVEEAVEEGREGALEGEDDGSSTDEKNQNKEEG